MLFNLTLHTCSPGVTLTELQKRGGMNDEAYAKVFIIERLMCGILYMEQIQMKAVGYNIPLFI